MDWAAGTNESSALYFIILLFAPFTLSLALFVLFLLHDKVTKGKIDEKDFHDDFLGTLGIVLILIILWMGIKFLRNYL